MRLLTYSLLFVAVLFSNCTAEGQNQNKKEGKDVVTIKEYLEANKKDYSKYAVTTFAGGCFWCTEAAFERIEGVVDVISGYSGGEKKNPGYYEVASGATKHAESIQIYFDPEVVSFEKLLEVFFVAHDPTQVNRQGPDVGPQYRSEIFYHDEAQKTAVETFFQKEEENFDKPIATLVNPYKEFWVAEAYHQDFYELNPNQSYVRAVSRPKVLKVEKKFKSILKEKFK